LKKGLKGKRGRGRRWDRKKGSTASTGGVGTGRKNVGGTFQGFLKSKEGDKTQKKNKKMREVQKGLSGKETSTFKETPVYCKWD